MKKITVHRPKIEGQRGDNSGAHLEPEAEVEGADIRGGARGEWREAMERGEGSEKGEDSCAHQVGRAAVSAVD